MNNACTKCGGLQVLERAYDRSTSRAILLVRCCLCSRRSAVWRDMITDLTLYQNQTPIPTMPQYLQRTTEEGRRKKF